MTRVAEAKSRCRRIVAGPLGPDGQPTAEYVVELRPEKIVMRPLRARGGRGMVAATWEQVYLRLFEPPARRQVSRGLLR